MDTSIVTKLEAVAGGDYVIMRRAEADQLRSYAGAPVSNGPDFSKDDLAALREIVRVYRGITALGALTGVAKSALYVMAAILVLVLWARGKLPFADMWKAVFG